MDTDNVSYENRKQMEDGKRTEKKGIYREIKREMIKLFFF